MGVTSKSRVGRARGRGEYLRGAMERGGFTRASLAAKLGVDQSYVSRIVSGGRTPSLEVAVAMAGYLGVPLVELAHVLATGTIPPTAAGVEVPRAQA